MSDDDELLPFDSKWREIIGRWQMGEGVWKQDILDALFDDSVPIPKDGQLIVWLIMNGDLNYNSGPKSSVTGAEWDQMIRDVEHLAKDIEHYRKTGRHRPFVEAFEMAEEIERLANEPHVTPTELAFEEVANRDFLGRVTESALRKNRTRRRDKRQT